MNKPQIDLSVFNDLSNATGPQEERIYFLIQKLREYTNLPIKEMRNIMPVLWEVQQKCKAYNTQHGLPAINYIVEILKALEAEHFQNENRVGRLSQLN